MNNKGVTLIELLIVIVVLGVIGGFTIVQVSSIVDNSRIEVDSFNLSTLTSVTENFAEAYPSGTSDVFDGYSDNDARMLALVDSKFLDTRIVAQQKDAYFDWNVSTQSWDLIGGEINGFYNGSGLSYSFSTDTLDSIESSGTVSINMDRWSTDDGYLENSTGETRLFIPISSNEYVITVDAALQSGSNGGYGVFFDITLRNDNVNRDDGYIFQFDRGYAEGAMIVRPRSNGGEQGAVWSLRANNTTAFPSEAEDPDWWTDTHTIKIIVSNINNTTREAEFFIDGISIGTYSYSNEIDGNQIYTGFRGWGGSPTRFYGLNVG